MLLLVLALTSAAAFDQLDSPQDRVERSEVLQPLRARRHPVHGREFIEPAPTPSASNVPLPQPVDTETTVIGNCIEHRQYLDYPEDLQIVFPGTTFAGDGDIHQWEIYSGRDCKLDVQVFRPAAVPLQLEENRSLVTSFTLIGTNTLSVPEMGGHTFQIPEHERIRVNRGDVIGLYTKSPGCVSWSSGGPTVLYRYGYPGHHELKAFKSVVFIGDGVHRTYSLAATGNFSKPINGLESRVSPSGSPSISPSHSPSQSPSLSPTHSVSYTPLPVPLSVSPSHSRSYSSTPSHTPSISPTLYSSKSECAKGVLFWCKNNDTMRMCNITQSMCDYIIDAMFPSLPSPLSSPWPVAPSATPTLQTVITIAPSVTPSPTLAIPPYFRPAETSEPNGLTRCQYCNGGSDWTDDTCAKGSFQSPVAVKFDSTFAVDPKLDLYFSTLYNHTWANLGWNDFAFTMASPYLGSINIDGINYVADMVMIRSPSEHKIEGVRAPLEMQVFHRLPFSNPPKTVALAILFEETAHEVPELDFIYELNFELNKPVALDLQRFVSDLKPLAFYDGSMTYPPCQEGITWAVSMGASARVSYMQIKKLNSLLKNNPKFAAGRGNNRLVQPLGNRKVTLRSNCGISGVACNRAPATSKGIPTENGGSAERVQETQLEHAKAGLASAAVKEEDFKDPKRLLEAAEAEMLKDVLSSDDADGMFDDNVKLW